MNADSVVLVAYGSDPLETLATLMLERHQRILPDLSQCVALFPHPGAIPHFRRTLLGVAERRDLRGLLAPWCGTLDEWLQQQTDDPGGSIDDPERDLLLLEALQSHATLRERYGTWPLVDSLLALFDELSANRPAILLEMDQFVADLTEGYGLREPIPPLHGEAQLVHTLWNAWNTHLHDRHLQDRALRHRTALVNARSVKSAAHHIYMVAPVELSCMEAQWLTQSLRVGDATVLLHGGTRSSGYHPDRVIRRCHEMLGVAIPSPNEPVEPYGKFIESVYADDTDIGTRARAFVGEFADSPLLDRLQVFAATDFEHEAQAVALAVRRWYAKGTGDIAIVTPDRKLARRVRALLERANLSLRDTAGWALSTTSAATAVMRWIECVEQDFAHAPLLDCLKSPFVTLHLPKPELDTIVHCFEEQIVRRYNIGGGLERYRRSVRANNTALAVDKAALLDMLDRLAVAAEPLLKLLNARRARTAVEYLSGIERSLDSIGLVEGLGTDAAGNQLLAVLRPIRSSLSAHGARLTWSEFHHWLQRELERRRFRPPLTEGGIDLLGLAESRCRRFGALVIAGCTRDNLPGTPLGSPFFNDGVRRQLGLPTAEDRLFTPFYDFRRLLESAPQILLTWRQAQDGEPVVPSPWVERLVAFHRLAYGGEPTDTELMRQLAAKQTELYRRDESPLPQPASVPTPSLPRQRIPSAMSAGAHQRLLDCPYQYYVVDGLGLRALDEVRDEMEKSDYGENVHRILHAFHNGANGLPGPWNGGPLGPANRADAAELLRDLGRRVFGFDRDKRLTTRGWYFRWENFIPTYVDWQEQREHEWEVEATEKTLLRELTIGERTLVLKGRADRIDHGPAGLAIIDYKTGMIPQTDAIESGEKTQLPFYALLAPATITEVLYAKFERDAIRTSVGAKDSLLMALVRQLEARLRALVERIDRGAALPAWGDLETCRFCRYQGLCRREMWSSAIPAPRTPGTPDKQERSSGEQLPLFPNLSE